MEKLFEQAARQKYRFMSAMGQLTTEDLWQLPLQSKNAIDLDSVAKRVNEELVAATETSFVKKASPNKGTLEAKMEIVKHIIAVRLEEDENRKTAAEKKAKKEKLLEALNKAEGKELESLTPEQIKAQLAALD